MWNKRSFSKLPVTIFIAAFVSCVNCLMPIRNLWPQSSEYKKGLTDFNHFESVQDFYLQLGTAIKHPRNPLLKPDNPWEGIATYLYGSVMYDSIQNIFRMWYQTFRFDKPGGERSYFCYAYSYNGFDWIKPNLGLVPYYGSTNNNIVLAPAGKGDMYTPSIFLDSEEKIESKKFKMVYTDMSTLDSGSIVNVAFSPDGIKWTKHESNPLRPPVTGDAGALLAKKIGNSFVLFSKVTVDNKRARAVTQSSDFLHWTYPQNILAPPLNGVPKGELYWMCASPWDDRFIGLVGIFDTDSTSNVIYPSFCYGENLFNWKIPDAQRQAIPLGKKGEFDSGMITVQDHVFLEVRDTIWTYYGGWNGPHSTYARKAAIGLARWPKKRFVGLGADEKVGSFLTKKFKLDTHELTITAEVKQDGYFVVGLYDQNGFPLNGFAEADFDTLKTTVENIPLSWHGISNLNILKGQDIRIYCSGKNIIIFDLGKLSNWGQSQEDSTVPVGLPKKIELYQNYPNPFNPTTTIWYGVSKEADVSLVIYNSLGQQVRNLLQQRRKTIGFYKVDWDGRNDFGNTVSNGLYIYYLKTDTESIAKKMLFIK